jgi:hypothetical protein
MQSVCLRCSWRGTAKPQQLIPSAPLAGGSPASVIHSIRFSGHNARLDPSLLNAVLVKKASPKPDLFVFSINTSLYRMSLCISIIKSSQKYQFYKLKAAFSSFSGALSGFPAKILEIYVAFFT